MRSLLAGVMLLVGLVLIPLGDLGVWTRREVLSTDSFTELANEVVQLRAARDALAKQLVDALVREVPELSVGRFVLKPAVEEVIGSRQFQLVFRSAVGDLHTMLRRGHDRLTLNLDAVIPVVKEEVAKVSGDVAALIPDNVDIPAVTVVTKEELPLLWRGVDVARTASWALPAACLVSLAAAVALARRRAAMLVLAGLGAALVGVVVMLLLEFGRGVLSEATGSAIERQAFDDGYELLTGTLVTQTLVVILGGFVMAAAGAGLAFWRRTNQRPGAWA